MPKRAAIYLRISTDKQTVEHQRAALADIAAQRGWTVAAEYADNGISGAKTREKRPGLDRMLKDASRAKFDVLMSWSIDRLGRSLSDLLATFNDLRAANVDLFIAQQALDTTTPSGRLVFQLTGAFAEFEREIIRARVNAGLATARRKGVKLGRRKIGTGPSDLHRAGIEVKIRARLSEGVGILKTAREFKVGTGTVQRIKAEMAAT